jgi:hypothetical protein
VILQEAHEHEQVSFWQDYISVAFDPAHIFAELTYQLVFDVLVLFLLWSKFAKPYFEAKLKQQHKELDAEHGIDHHEEVETEVEESVRVIVNEYTAGGTA